MLLVNVHIPLPFRCIIAFFRYHFPIPVVILVPWFMAATLLVAFIMILLSVPFLWAMPWFSMPVITAPMRFVPVTVISMRVITFMWVVLLWLYVCWISAILCFWVKSFLSRQATTNAATMIMVMTWRGRTVLRFPGGLSSCFFFPLGSSSFQGWLFIHLIFQRALVNRREL